MRKAIWVLFCGSILLVSGGCATILGGIIGYQSAELCAGLAIGAALDFGDDLGRGVGEALADPAKEFQKGASFNADQGSIKLPAIAFTPDRMQKVKARLQDTFTQNGWSANVIEKTAKTGLFRRDRFGEKWRCTTPAGEPFVLQIRVEQGQEAHLTVTLSEESQADRAQVTTQIYDWLEAICTGKL